MESTLAVQDYISVGRKRDRKGLRRHTTEKFNGYNTVEVLKLGKKQPQQLTRKERLALELYWNARLAAMGETMSRGYNPDWLTYEADIGVLDFFADRTYILPTERGEI